MILIVADAMVADFRRISVAAAAAAAMTTTTTTTTTAAAAAATAATTTTTAARATYPTREQEPMVSGVRYVHFA
jgi:hypothetical protein